MAAAGLRPIGIFSHFYFTADRGISKGFAEWSNDGAKSIADSNKDIAAPRIVPKVIERLKQAAARQERFVLWTHLFEPHSSYMPHPEFPTTLSGVAGLEEKYDYEIAYDDQWIGKILQTLDETKLAEHTAIVAFGDHGEAWGEHKRIYFHGQNLTGGAAARSPHLHHPWTRARGFRRRGRAHRRGADPARSPRPRGAGPSAGPQPAAGHRRRPPAPAPDLRRATALDRHARSPRRHDRPRPASSCTRFPSGASSSSTSAPIPGQMKNLADDPAHGKTLEELKARLLAHEERRAP